MSNPAGAFLGSRTTLRPAHAVAALLQLSDGRYLMQLRDSNPDIFYPEHWGCFGGAVDAGEAPTAALVRELKEELAVNVIPSDVSPLHRIHLRFRLCGRRNSAADLLCRDPAASGPGRAGARRGRGSCCVRGREAACNAACGPVRRFRAMDAPCTRAACLVPPSCGAHVLGWVSVPERSGRRSKVT